MKVETARLIIGKFPVEENQGIVLGITTGQEAKSIASSDFVRVRNQLQRRCPRASSVDEVLDGSPARDGDKGHAEEDKGGLRAEDVGLVVEVLVEAGAVDGEVGDSRWVDEPEGNLDELALHRVTAGGGRVPVSRDTRRIVK